MSELRWCAECFVECDGICLHHGFCGDCRLVPTLRMVLLMVWRSFWSRSS